MKAVVLEKPCEPQDLVVRNVPIPEVKPGWVRVKIKAFGINRPEMYTRQGHPHPLSYRELWESNAWARLMTLPIATSGKVRGSRR